MADDLEDRIRRRAHQIWEREGCPEGRHADHWTLAKEEIAIEDNYGGTLKPNPSNGPDDTAVRTEPVEPVLSMASQGEMPGITDQGEEFQIPGRGDRTPWPETDTDRARDRGATGTAPATGEPGRRRGRSKVAG